MWYTDPVVACPIIWGSISVAAFIIMILVVAKGYKTIGVFFAAVFAGFGFPAVFVFAFGWMLNNPDKMEIFGKWIGTI